MATNGKRSGGAGSRFALLRVLKFRVESYLIVAIGHCSIIFIIVATVP